MTDQTMRRSGRAPTIAATPLAAALLALSCATAEAGSGWLQKGLQQGGKMWVKDQIESYVKPNVNAVGTLGARLVGIFNNASGGDGDMDAVNKSMGQFIKEAVPAVDGALNFGEAVINAPENLKDMLKSAERKVRSVVRRTGEAVVDPIAALAFPSKSDREYASKAGLFDEKPLPTVRVVAARSPDPRSVADGGASDNAAVTHVGDAKGTGVVALAAEAEAVEAKKAAAEAEAKAAAIAALQPKCVESPNSEPCWQEVDEQPGCYVSRGGYSSGDSVRGRGECRNAMIVRGTLSIRTANGVNFRGPYVDGKLNGHWVERYPDGQVQEGSYVDGRKSGHWVFRFPDGQVQEGPLVDGKWNGHWVIRFPDGQVQEGPYVDGYMHGRFVWRNVNRKGDCHTGRYSMGQPETTMTTQC